MPSLNLEQLGEILSDLGPEFSALSDEGRSDLCNEINQQFRLLQGIRKGIRDNTPYKRIERWQQVERETEKLQKLLHSLEFDMKRHIDRVRGRTMEPPTQAQVQERMSTDPTVASFLERCRTQNFPLPSRQAHEEARRIKEGLSTLLAVAQSGINEACERKNSKRKHDVFQGIFLMALARAYEKTFLLKPSTRREGKWPIFLARVLSIIEHEEISSDAAYDSWRILKNIVPKYELISSIEFQNFMALVVTTLEAKKSLPGSP